MTTALFVFFAVGVVFGLATFGHRHLFSEGTTRPGEDSGLGSRLVWVMVCSALWPIFILTGLYSAGHRARQRARVRDRQR